MSLKTLKYVKLLFFFASMFIVCHTGLFSKPTVNIARTGDTQVALNWKDTFDGGKLIVIRMTTNKPVSPADAKKYQQTPIFNTNDKESVTGAGNVVVYQGTGNSGNLFLINLPADKEYFADFYYFNKTSKKIENKSTPASVKFAILAETPTMQAASIYYENVSANSMTIKWGNGTGKGRIVVLRELKESVKPKNGTYYKPETIFGKGSSTGDGSYVVYNGQGNQVQVKNLKPNTQYFVRIVEYNGEGSRINYLDKDIGGNPSKKTTLLTAPKIDKPESIESKDFIARWKKSPAAETYLLDVAYDREFKSILGRFKDLDVGDLDNYWVTELEPGKKYFYRVAGKSSGNFSEKSEPMEVILKK